MRLNRAPTNDVLLIGALALLAVVIRLAGRHEVTADMRIFYAWYDRLDAAGGFGGLDQEIGNYNAPFLYLLAALTYLPGATLIKIKALWCLFDVLLVYFTYRLVALCRPGWRIPALAALVMAFLPTVVVNSSFWGQNDVLTGAFALGGLYFLLRQRPWWGVSLITVSFAAVKPQAIFIFPLLGLLALAGKLPWRTLPAIPLVYVALDLPAILAGRDPVELLTLYSPARQASHVPALTSNAASVYAFLDVSTRVDTLKTLGYVFAAVFALGLTWALLAARARLDPGRILTVALILAIGVPFLLPGMHERYFYLADVLAVVVAFHRPRLWPAVVVLQVTSLCTYGGFLFGRSTLLDLELLAALQLGLLIWLLADLARSVHAERETLDLADLKLSDGHRPSPAGPRSRPVEDLVSADSAPNDV